MRTADDCLEKDLGPPSHCNIMHFDVHLPALATPSDHYRLDEHGALTPLSNLLCFVLKIASTNNKSASLISTSF